MVYHEELRTACQRRKPGLLQASQSGFCLGDTTSVSLDPSFLVPLPPLLLQLSPPLESLSNVKILIQNIQRHLIHLLPLLPILPPQPFPLPLCSSKIKTLLRRRRLPRLLPPRQQRPQLLLPLGNANASSPPHTRHDRRIEKPRHAKDCGVQHVEWGSERKRKG